MMIDENKFPCFSSALRLIVLVKVSSCAVKRVFSQIKYVLYVCGNVYEDHLVVRIFNRCNGDSNPLWIQTLNNY